MHRFERAGVALVVAVLLGAGFVAPASAAAPSGFSDQLLTSVGGPTALAFVSPNRLLIASQPTRVLDVGSIEFIHHQILAERDQGRAVLLVSAELDEVLALADRVGVMYRGRLVALLPRAEATRERLGLLMAGGHEDGKE